MRRPPYPFASRVLVLTALVMTAPVVRADPPSAPSAAPKRAAAEEDLAPLLASIRAKHDVPALCALRLQHDRVSAIGVTGVRRRGEKAKATIDDLWHLGSCTKAMTATLCAKLVEERSLRFEMRLADGPKGFVPKTADAGWAEATLEHFLSNRSGAPGGLERDGLWGRLWGRAGPPGKQRQVLLEGVLRHPPGTKPGTTYAYSNAGFSIAGILAEAVTKTPYEELMKAKVFTPLGMTSAAFGPPGTAAALDQPRGHTSAGVPVEPGPAADNPPSIAPAGLAHMTIRDWGRYAAVHLLGDRGESPFLSPSSFARLHTPSEGFEYAMGWIVTSRPWGGGIVLTHSGSNTMWYCVAWIAPKRDFAVLVTCNQGGDEAAKACDDVAAALVTR